MYKRNGCFSLVWVYFIFFHLFRNAQAVGSSPTISSILVILNGYSPEKARIYGLF